MAQIDGDNNCDTVRTERSEGSLKRACSAHHFAQLIVQAVDDARTRGDNRCPMCQWVFTSSITHDERHPDWCGYKQAKDALNKFISRE